MTAAGTPDEAPPPLTPAEVIDLTQRVLRSILDKRLDHASLRRLPGMHAVLLARVAWQARVLTRADLDKLAHEAQFGPLKPHRKLSAKPKVRSTRH